MAKNYKKQSNGAIVMAIIIVSLVILDGFIWCRIAASLVARVTQGNAVAHDYFLDVGQGVSDLVVLPGGIKVMTDAGSTDAAVGQLESILPQGDDYIDLAIISDPAPDDFGGYAFILDHYRVGAFIYDGRDADPQNPSWSALKQKIAAQKIPLITLGRGDVIRYDDDNDHDNNNDHDAEIDILSPDQSFAESAALADASLVLLVKTPQFKTLLMPDAGPNVGESLVDRHDDVRADVVNVSDQGSNDPSRDEFLRAANPAALIVNPSLQKIHAQPASSTLPNLASAIPNALILTTAQNGTIQIYPEDGKLKVVKNK